MTTATVPITITCPDWCERTDHDLECMKPGDKPLHRGSAFGLLEPSALGDESPTIDTNAWTLDEFDGLGPAALRKLALDALSAAEWLEAHQ